MTVKGRGRMDIAVLYVEDEPVMRQVFVEVLATKTRKVYQAATGEEGLEMFKQHYPDVAIIDNNMPSMDGLTLARALQALAPALPIIIVSGDIRRKNLMQVEHMQLHFIKKPIRIRELLHLLEQFAQPLQLSAFPAISPALSINS